MCSSDLKKEKKVQESVNYTLALEQARSTGITMWFSLVSVCEYVRAVGFTGLFMNHSHCLSETVFLMGFRNNP